MHENPVNRFSFQLLCVHELIPEMRFPHGFFTFHLLSVTQFMKTQRIYVFHFKSFLLCIIPFICTHEFSLNNKKSFPFSSLLFLIVKCFESHFRDSNVSARIFNGRQETKLDQESFPRGNLVSNKIYRIHFA